MRSLKGDVDILGLGNLLQLLSFNKSEGVLTVSQGPERKTIHFGPEGIRLLSSSMRRINKLGKILLRRHAVSKEDLDALLKEQKLLGWKLGQIALTSGLVKKPDIEEALREQVEEEIFDLFMWTEATFEFTEGRAPKEDDSNPLSGLTFGTSVTSLVMEAARRTDELLVARRLLNSDKMAIEKFDFEIQADELGNDLEVVETILPLMNGRRTLEEIVDASIYPRFATMRAIYHLLTLGYIKVHDRKGRPIQTAPGAERVRG
ncbi:MAG TPA: DUF4388 domain-containing protein [Planctomycetota bacterium]|jgi:hypothetical protein|nr:DUF4388 domain-containing protein [Planctomycetota bacterium]